MLYFAKNLYCLINIAGLDIKYVGSVCPYRGRHDIIIITIIAPIIIIIISTHSFLYPHQEQRASINRTKSNPMQVADCSHSDHINEVCMQLVNLRII